MKKIRVLIIDDSALVRQMLTEILESDSSIEVVGVAIDPYVARKKIKELKPDILTLDVEMPRMDGVTFLSNLMRLHPLPVVMVSSLTEEGADVTLQAMELGAVDFVTKPKIDLANTLDDYSEEIIEKVKVAANVSVSAIEKTVSRESHRADAGSSVPEKHSVDKIIKPKYSGGHFKTTDRIIAIGASTGGTEAIKEVVLRMPPNAPGIVITQHIPAMFSGPFAKRLNASAAMSVAEAIDGQQVLPGHVYIAPGDQHLLLERDGARYVCRLNDGEPVNRHKPSVDVMFRSVAQNAGKNAIGVILTGMGKDGSIGLKEMKEVGSHTIAQDEASSVVWGMPGESVKIGAAVDVHPLDKIADKILNQLN